MECRLELGCILQQSLQLLCGERILVHDCGANRQPAVSLLRAPFCTPGGTPWMSPVPLLHLSLSHTLVSCIHRVAPCIMQYPGVHHPLLQLPPPLRQMSVQHAYTRARVPVGGSDWANSLHHFALFLVSVCFSCATARVYSVIHAVSSLSLVGMVTVCVQGTRFSSATALRAAMT